MGWLADLDRKQHPSLRAAARAAHGSWKPRPREPGKKLSPGSFMAVVGKLDRGEQLGWLVARPSAKAALVEALGCTPHELEAGLAKASGAELLDLVDLPGKPTIDLRADRLFEPALPPEVLDPGRWSRTLWLAHSGEGRTAVGRWLEARGLAAYVPAEPTWAEARGKLSPDRPTFVELTTAADIDALLSFSERDDVCVALPSPVLRASGWTIVRSPQPEEYVADLVAWVALRLEITAAARIREATTLLEELLVGNAGLLIGSTSDAIAIAGLALTHPDALRAESAVERARRVIEIRLASAGIDAPSDGIVEALVGAMRRAVADPESSWLDGRSRERWVELLGGDANTAQYRAQLAAMLDRARALGADEDKIRESYALAGGWAEQDFERLVRSGLLKPRQRPDHYSLHPFWIQYTLARHAIDSAIERGPAAWGAIVKADLSADELLFERANFERAGLLRLLHEGDPRFVRDAIDAVDAEASPEHVGALEWAFRAVGRALIDEVAIDESLLADLWRAQVGLLVARGSDRAAGPRLPSRRTWPGSTDGAFYLAALAISRRLDLHSDAPGVAPLAPWHHVAAPSGLGEVLDAIGRHHGDRVHRLIARLPLDRGGRATGQPQLPAQVVEAAWAPDPWPLLDLEDAPSRDALELAAQARERAWTDCVSALWDRWAESEEPLPPLMLDGALGFWEGLTEGAWKRLWSDGPPDDAWPALWEHAAERLIAAFSDQILERSPPRSVDGLLQTVPVERHDALLDELEPPLPWTPPEHHRASVARWLQELVAARAEGWERAFELLWIASPRR